MSKLAEKVIATLTADEFKGDLIVGGIINQAMIVSGHPDAFPTPGFTPTEASLSADIRVVAKRAQYASSAAFMSLAQAA